jgi:hypothetical protein
MYKHADLRPWDPRNDVCQYEYNYVIQTKTRHQTPMIRTASIVSVDPQTVVSFSVLFSSLQQCSPKGYIEYSKGWFLWFFSLFTKVFIAEQFHKTGVRFEAFTALNIEVVLLWDLMAYSVADTNQYSRGRDLADYLVSLSSILQSYSLTMFSH